MLAAVARQPNYAPRDVMSLAIDALRRCCGRLAAVGRTLRQRWRWQRSGRSEIEQTLSFDAAGLTLATTRWGLPHQEQRMRWDDVAVATAYKRDLWTVDQICLCFDLRDGGCLVVSEDARGWVALVEALPELLVGFPPSRQWLPEVALPAFAANETELLRR
jgi:hypothetical protein